MVNLKNNVILRILWVSIFSMIFFIIGCSDDSSVDIKFDISSLKECVKNEDHCVTILSVSTKNISKDSYLPYSEALTKLKYDYHIIGTDLDWRGWITRGAAMKGAMIYLKNNFSPKELKKIVVASSDTGDVLVQKGPAELIKMYKAKTAELEKNYKTLLDTENLIIVGGEWWCSGNCEKQASSWFDRLEIPNSKRYFPHPQGGFIMGPVDALYDYYTYTTQYMTTVENDDQIAMGNFAIEYPEKIYIDYKQEIAATILMVSEYYPSEETGLNLDENNLYEFTNKGLSLSKKLIAEIGRIDSDGVYPAFLHMPNNTRKEVVKTYWNKLVAHLRQTVWED